MNLKLWSWAFYDFANTIFSAIVITAYFPLYFTALTEKNWTLGATTTASMILSGLVVPYLGTVSDRTGKTKQYLIQTTLACIACLIPLSFFKHPSILLIFFALSCFFFHASLVFYNSLLPVAADPKKQGFASGLGTGLGYLGVLAALPLANLSDSLFGMPSVFILAAVLFFIFSIPLFVWVPEREVTKPLDFDTRLLGEEWRKVFSLAGSLRKKPALLCFFLGNFLALDALNSTIFWFMVYAREVFGAPQEALIGMMMAVNAGAFIFGLITGHLTDKMGALKILILSTSALAVTLIALVFSLNFHAFVLCSAIGGAFAIAGIWTSGRKALVDFAPPDQLGQYFGLYGLTTKVSVIGSFIFSVLADMTGFQIALLSLVIPSVSGAALILLSARLKN